MGKEIFFDRGAKGIQIVNLRGERYMKRTISAKLRYSNTHRDEIANELMEDILGCGMLKR